MQHTQPIHIHTQAHTISIHTRMCIPTYNIHSFTYRQCTAMLAYTYTYRAAAYLAHTSAQLRTLAHTVCMIHLHRDTHSHTKVNIIVLYTQICTRGASTIDTLCRGADSVGSTHSVACLVALYQRPPQKTCKKTLDTYTLLCYTKYIRKR